MGSKNLRGRRRDRACRPGSAALIAGGEEGGLVMIEPPGDFGRRGVLEVDDGVLVAGEIGFVEEGAGAVDEAMVLVESEPGPMHSR